MTARCRLDFCRPVDFPLLVFEFDEGVVELSAEAAFVSVLTAT